MLTASLILAAGRGSRMKGFQGNKTLLPLVPEQSPYEGSRPILREIVRNLPAGPKAVVVHFMKEEVIQATRDLGLAFCEQPTLNGTGGALLASRAFLEAQQCRHVIITMGDVPFVGKDTYLALLEALKGNSLVVLGFRPRERKQYGVLEIRGDRVLKITEWKYWRSYPERKKRALTICNSGIYTAKREELLRYLEVLASRPHLVHKEIDGTSTVLEDPT